MFQVLVDNLLNGTRKQLGGEDLALHVPHMTPVYICLILYYPRNDGPPKTKAV